MQAQRLLAHEVVRKVMRDDHVSAPTDQVVLSVYYSSTVGFDSMSSWGGGGRTLRTLRTVRIRRPATCHGLMASMPQILPPSRPLQHLFYE
jgi:hypothetical protein